MKNTICIIIFTLFIYQAHSQGVLQTDLEDQIIKPQWQSYTINDFKQPIPNHSNWRLADINRDTALLDSIVYYYAGVSVSDTILDQKIEFGYNDDNIQNSSSSYTWNETQKAWEGEDREDNSRNDLGLIESTTTFQWVAESAEWEYETKVEHTFEDSLQIQVVSSVWDMQNAVWVNETKTEYIRDEDGLMLESTSYQWDEGDNDWVNDSYSLYSRDAEGQISLRIGYLWDKLDEKWVNDQKQEYSYRGDTILITDLIWENGWANTTQTIITFDENGRQTSYILANWDDQAEGWVNEGMSEYGYDANGNQVGYISYDWNTLSKKWIGSLKYDVTLNELGRQSQWHYYLWSTITNSWEPILKLDYTYDENGYQTGYVNHNWNSNTEEWYLVVYAEYHYTTIEIIPLAAEVLPQFQVYPNPTSDLVQFNLTRQDTQASFKLYNMNGVEVLSSSVSDEEVLSLSTLSKGLYLYTLEVSGEVQKGKLVKQ